MNDHEQIGRLVTAVERAEEELVAAREALDAHFADLGRRLVETGEPQIPLDLARNLYWDYPSVPVKAIGLAIGVPASRVYAVTGGSRKIVCTGCGETYTDGRTSRTRPGTTCSPTPTCPACTTAARERRAAEWDARQPEREERHQERIAQLNAGDYWIDVDGEVVLSDLDGTAWWHNCRACGATLRRISGEPAWRSGKGVVFVCPAAECGDDRQAPQLVRYIPGGAA